tara:strand:- start:685 stop:807 length:123 start_codon:yes stop_codon:yes gene_type:complete
VGYLKRRSTSNTHLTMGDARGIEIKSFKRFDALKLSCEVD